MDNAKYILLFTVGITLLTVCSQQSGVPDNYELVYHQNFQSPGSMHEFEFSDPDQWGYTQSDNGRGALEFQQAGNYAPPVRSPRTIGLLSGRQFGSFVLEVDLLQTGREYGHRDMCLFFNVRDSSHFYYVHLATKADPHAHNIFIVDGEPRTAIASKTTEGIDWGEEVWHQVRLERNVQDGSIQVYYDKMDRPIMTATDTTFRNGYVGFGSFDDSGKIDNIEIWAPGVAETEEPLFSPKE